MSEQHAIRAYAASDEAALSDIWWRASLAAHSFLGEPLLREQRKLVEQVYLPEAETYLAMVADRPAGFIGLLDSLIGALFVDPVFARHGLGRALVAHALTLKPELELEVYAANEKAHAFYSAIGGVETGRRPIDDNGLPFELIRMELRS